MKKRVKLLTTIASLCLAVALMAFGVYAATQQTMAVSSNVSFTAQVDVTWGWGVAGGYAVEKGTDGTYGTADDVVGEQVLAIADQSLTFNAQAEEKTITVTDAATLDGKTAIPERIQFQNNDNATVTYTFKCTNNGASAINVAVDHTAITGVDNLTATYKTVNDTVETDTRSATNTVEAGKTITFTVELKILDSATEVIATPVEASFVANHDIA